MQFVDLKGVPMPAIGLGTWELRGAEGAKTIAQAIEVGYRHIDTSESYGNEDAVGAAIAASTVARQDLFLTTKLTSTSHGRHGPAPALAGSLGRLRTDYVDLLLIHWPNPSVPVAETLEAMLELQSKGLVRRIGVSNFPVALMRDAVAAAGDAIVCNQVEYHLGLSQRSVLAYAREQGIVVTAYTPLLKGDVANQPLVQQIARKHGKTPGQIALRWLVQQPGVAAIPKAASRDNQQRNLEIFDFSLDGEDMRALDAFGPSKRVINPVHGPKWDVD